jgi:hypothetical protein
MLNMFRFTYTDLTMAVFSVALLLLGGLITFYSLTADGGLANAKIFTPLGILIIISGLLILTSKED